jgi:hypothetical protein
MYLYIIKLKEILNDPSTLNLHDELCPLNQSDKPPLLIYGNDLGEKILKSKDFIPLNIIDYFKAINNIPNSKFPSIELYFKKSPLFLKDPMQVEARNVLSILYKNIEDKLLLWLPHFTRKYLAEINGKEIHDPVAIAEQFTLDVFKKMIFVELDCEENSSIEFPGGILNTYKSKNSLEDYDRKLNLLFKFIEGKLIKIDRPAEDAWKIISIVVMGTEAISNSLAFSMALNPNHKKKWDAEALFKELSPISFTARLCAKETKIKNVLIQEGQEVYVALSIINQLSKPKDKSPEQMNSFSFSLGRHMCPGRKISLIITQTFLDAWEDSKGIKVNSSPMNATRDLVLRLKENK